VTPSINFLKQRGDGLPRLPPRAMRAQDNRPSELSGQYNGCTGFVWFPKWNGICSAYAERLRKKWVLRIGRVSAQCAAPIFSELIKAEQ
jgi:hypothetical protein